MGHDASLKKNTVWIFMQYAKGGDLAMQIDKMIKLSVKFKEKEVFNIFIQICRGLQHIHSLNLMHRDLKPGNFFLTT